MKTYKNLSPEKQLEIMLLFEALPPYEVNEENCVEAQKLRTIYEETESADALRLISYLNKNRKRNLEFAKYCLEDGKQKGNPNPMNDCDHRNNGMDMVKLIDRDNGIVRCPVCKNEWDAHGSSREELESHIKALKDSIQNTKWVGECNEEEIKILGDTLAALENFPIDLCDDAINHFEKRMKKANKQMFNWDPGMPMHQSISPNMYNPDETKMNYDIGDMHYNPFDGKTDYAQYIAAMGKSMIGAQMYQPGNAMSYPYFGQKDKLEKNNEPEDGVSANDKDVKESKEDKEY